MAEHFHPLRIAEIVPETNEANSIRFEIPPELRDKFADTEGWTIADQYVGYDQDFISVIDARGDEALGSTWSFLDITPYGRQEEWEDSPDGWPQTPPYTWGGWHDRYDHAL